MKLKMNSVLALLFSPLSQPFIPKTFFAKPAVGLMPPDGLFTEKSYRECYIITFQWRILDMFFFFSSFF